MAKKLTQTTNPLLDDIEHNGVMMSRQEVWCMAMFMCLGNNKISCVEPCEFCWNDALNLFAETSHDDQKQA